MILSEQPVGNQWENTDKKYINHLNLRYISAMITTTRKTNAITPKTTPTMSPEESPPEKYRKDINLKTKIFLEWFGNSKPIPNSKQTIRF